LEAAALSLAFTVYLVHISFDGDTEKNALLMDPDRAPCIALVLLAVLRAPSIRVKTVVIAEEMGINLAERMWEWNGQLYYMG
jgi:hypothetical protein